MVMTTRPTKTCKRCTTRLPGAVFGERQDGYREAVCMFCRDEMEDDTGGSSVANSFGPLPGFGGSRAWVSEVWRRAAVVREENRCQPSM